MKHILQMFGEPITYGGQESVVFNMLSYLYSDNSFKQNYVVDAFTPYYANNKKVIELIEKNGGKVYALNETFKEKDNRYISLYNPIKNFFINNKFFYDIVHIHSGSIMTMYVATKVIKKLYARKIIVHSHTVNNNNSLLKKIYLFLLNYFLSRYVDYYLACSEMALKSKFLNYTNNVNSRIIYNGIDIDKFKFNEKDRNNLLNELNFNNKIIIGFLGRLVYSKNIPYILNIIEKILYMRPDMKEKLLLIIVGDGDLLLELKKKALIKQICNNVIFTGNREDAYRYYQIFDILLMPSKYEGLGISAVEGQVSGLNVIASKGVDKMCTCSNKISFISTDNIDFWVNKVISIIDNKLYINRTDGIDFDLFDRNKTFKEVLKIYEYLCNN